jgi:hypothetical protein
MRLVARLLGSSGRTVVTGRTVTEFCPLQLSQPQNNLEVRKKEAPN